MATAIPRNRAMFSLGEAARACGGTLRGDASIQVCGVVIDSRAAIDGALFVALRGETHDAHAFVGDALEAGCSAVIVERGRAGQAEAAIEVDDTTRALGDLAAYHRRRWPGRVVAITGSAGKTTTKEMARAALRAAGDAVTATQGNLNNLVGVPMTLLTLDDTTRTAVIEIGTNRPGEIARLTEMTGPDVGVVTSVALAHVEGLGSLQEVAAEKAALLLGLRDDGVAIVPDDCPPLAPFVSHLLVRRLSFGCGEQTDVRLSGVRMGADLASHCRFVTSAGEVTVSLGLLGKAAALDAAAALAVVVALHGAGEVPRALAGLRAMQPVAARLHAMRGVQGSVVLDDSYNANPASAREALDVTRQLADALGGRAMAVLGDMAELGCQTEPEHRRLGAYAVDQGVELFIGCGPHMKTACDGATERAAELARAGCRVIHLPDPLAAPALVLRELRARDVVLVKGSRSMRMERVLPDLRDGSPA